jgi:hypothetical protein
LAHGSSVLALKLAELALFTFALKQIGIATITAAASSAAAAAAFASAFTSAGGTTKNASRYG